MFGGRDPVEVLLVEIGQRHVRNRGAGVVERQVQPPEMLDGGIHGVLDAARGGQISHGVVRGSASGSNPVRHPDQLGLGAGGQEHDAPSATNNTAAAAPVPRPALVLMRLPPPR
jgi:hypothetical protein